jgi:hypothetical protein
MSLEPDCELTAIPQLQEWDSGRSEGVIVSHPSSFLLQGHWELTFLYLSAFLFGMWLGVTGDKFEHIMAFSLLTILVGGCVYLFGRLATEDLLRENTKLFFSVTLFFALSVCVFHFLRLKIEPPSIM